MFHRGKVTTTIHNLYKRKKLMRSACFYTKKDNKMKIGDLKNEDFTQELQRLIASKDDPFDALHHNGKISTFLRSAKIVTRSMSHTEASAKSARQKFLALAFKYGVPSIMFTISPSSVFQFRIKVMATKSPERPFVPDIDDDDELLCDFSIDLEEISLKYLGLAAIDFESILSITINDLLCVGSNFGGIFGIVITYGFCVEEQSRGELHCHFLLWVKILI